MTIEIHQELKKKIRMRNGSIDLDVLKQLAGYHVQNQDLADYFQCSVSLLSCEPYHSIIQQAKSSTRCTLKKKAIEMAFGGDSKMLIFVLKNYCSMEENPNHSQSNVEDGSSNDNFEGFSINVGK